MSQQNPVPGWYPDPENAGKHRYWDGLQWTDQRQDSDQGRPPRGGLSTGQKWGIAGGVLAGFVVLGALASAGDSAGEPQAADTTDSAPVASETSAAPAAKVKGRITNTKVLNPATIAFTAVVKNTGETDVESTVCLVKMQDPSGTYKGSDVFFPEGAMIPGFTTGFAGQITITNEGAVWITETSIKCEPSD